MARVSGLAEAEAARSGPLLAACCLLADIGGRRAGRGASGQVRAAPTAVCLPPTAYLLSSGSWEGRLVSKRRIWQIIRNVILMLAALAAGFFFLVVPWFIVSIGTTGRYHYPDPNDGKTPISYRMNFKWVEFPSSDGVLLKGWYVPATSGAAARLSIATG